jgi:hypothetical protein
VKARDRLYAELEDAIERGDISDAEARNEWLGELEDAADRLREEWR